MDKFNSNGINRPPIKYYLSANKKWAPIKKYVLA